MAPSNLSQVFVVNNVSMLTGTTFNQSTATSNASKLGIWNIDATAATTASISLAAGATTALGTTVTVTSTTGLLPGMVVVKTGGTGTLAANTTVISVTNSTTFVISAPPTVDLSAATMTATASVIGGSYTVSPIENLKRIQFTQSTLGNIISSPIIDVNQIVRVNYNGFLGDAQTTAIQTITPAGIPTAGKNIMVRIALRTAPTNYESYANPTNPLLDQSGSSKVFPLVGNFAAGRMIFNIEVPTSAYGTPATPTVAEFVTYVRAGFAANKTLDAIFSTSGTSSLVVTARHLGVEFDIVCQYSDASGVYATSVLTRSTPASNYVQVISDEKSQRARYGNFNRMYFPVAQTDYAQPGYKYDIFEIHYTHGHPVDTGIARAGEVNIIKVYVGSSSTALSAAADFITVFGTLLPSLAIATDKDGVLDLAPMQP